MFNEPSIAEALRDYVTETGQSLALRLDTSLNVTEINAHTRELLGPDVLGRPMLEQIVDFMRPVDLPALIRKSGEVHRLTLKTAAGMPESVDFRFFPLPDGALALGCFDFQEQKKLRQEMLKLNGELNNLTRQLHQTNAELRELNQLKNQFLGMAAHDLRAPVGLIINYSEFVLDEAGEQLSEEHREFLQICLNSAEDMQRLIESFLDFSVIESGHLQLQLETTSVTQILDNVGPITRLLAGKKKISLLIDATTEGAPTLDVDAPKIQQALVNMINNAIQHSQPGQRVWVSARTESNEVVFTVRDEGQGLTPEDQARLFQPFERAGTKKTACERSIGLGLALARKVITAHGGRIWIESIPGHGATFLFSVPTLEQNNQEASL
jgi:signal transduction histidine kinase